MQPASSPPATASRLPRTDKRWPLLLGLDLSRQAGWCRLRRYESPTFGTIDLERYLTLHERLGRYDDWLEGTHRDEPVDGVAWEGPHLMPHDKMATLLLLYGLITLTRRFAWRHNLPWFEAPIPDVKAALLGSTRVIYPKSMPRAERTKLAKQAMVAAAMEKMGWYVEDHHQADAGGVGLVGYDNLWPG